MFKHYRKLLLLPLPLQLSSCTFSNFAVNLIFNNLQLKAHKQCKVANSRGWLSIDICRKPRKRGSNLSHLLRAFYVMCVSVSVCVCLRMQIARDYLWFMFACRRRRCSPFFPLFASKGPLLTETLFDFFHWRLQCEDAVSTVATVLMAIGSKLSETRLYTLSCIAAT